MYIHSDPFYPTWPRLHLKCSLCDVISSSTTSVVELEPKHVQVLLGYLVTVFFL